MSQNSSLTRNSTSFETQVGGTPDERRAASRRVVECLRAQ